MPTFTGTNADEIITPSQVSNTVTRDPAGSFPSAVFDVINAGGGNDVVSGGAGNDSVTLGFGNDRYIWNLGDEHDVVDGGDGTDTAVVTGNQNGQTIEVYAQNQYGKVAMGGGILSAQTTEIIYISALGGADAIHIADLAGTAVQRVNVDLGASVAGPADGAPDDVFVTATSGNDQIAIVQDGSGLKVTGLAAEVSVRGGNASDVLQVNGGAGNDRIDASAAPTNGVALALYGGDGNDTLIGSAGTDYLSGHANNDVIEGRGGTDYIDGGTGSDSVSGGDGDDFVSGGADDDVIEGGIGNDTLYGATGNDVIFGGEGKDVIAGNQGNDKLTGGKGADQFIFAQVNLGTQGLDKIRDFKPGKDSIAFDFLDELGAKLNKGEFVVGKKAKDADDHVIYNDKKGMLYFDGDGKGGDAAFAFAKIGKHLDLTHKDFDILVS